MTPQERKREYNREYRARNYERLLEADRARYAANKEQMNARNRAYRQAHAAEIAEREKRNYELKREEILERERQRYAAETDRIKSVQRAYRARRPPAVIDRQSRRRARLAEVESAPYRPSQIFERDGWTCQICVEPIDRDVRFPNSMCASIDHIIPLSAGGPDVPDNLQATHLVCNIRKGAALPAAV